MLTLATEKKGMLKFDVTVRRVTKKRLSPEKLKEQLQFISEAAKRNRAANFTTSIPRKLVREVELGTGDDRTLHYTAVITVMKERYIDKNAVERKFEKTKMVMEKAARRMKWELVGEEALIASERNGELIVVNGAGEPTDDPAPRLYTPKKRAPASPYYLGGMELPPLTPEVMRDHFGRIYDREAHIRIIYDNLRVAVKTRFKARHHILLKGPPACAKTELFLAFIEWLGEELIEPIDASTMTKAGLERLLLEKAESGTLKPILLMEEIEKCHPDNVSCLIQVMDSRGKIQRVNAHTVRDGDGVADAPIILWGTCNDEDELLKAHKGAIWSRFSNKLDCERPDRELMAKILYREVEEIFDPAEWEIAKEVWVPVVLKFCYDELASLTKFKKDFDDPRFARALMVGGARLLDEGPEGYLADRRKTFGIKKR